MNKDRVVLLDRDGVINADKPGYILSWEEFRFLRGSKSALKMLRQSGYAVHVVSNQSAVGRGLLTRKKLDQITSRMLDAIRRAGGDIQGVHYCTHRPEENCGCRKPRLGLFREVARKFDMNLKKAWLIGDKLTDIEAGNAMGCRTVLVKTGGSPEAEKALPGQSHTPYLIAENLLDAVQHIIREDGPRQARVSRKKNRQGTGRK